MRSFSVTTKTQSKHQPGLAHFMRSLKQSGLNRQQIKTLRGQALSGDLSGAQKGLERMVLRHEDNRAL